MKTALLQFLRDETGATAIEYALLGVLVAVALAASFAVLGDSLSSLFGTGAGGPAAIIGEAADTL